MPACLCIPLWSTCPSTCCTHDTPHPHLSLGVPHFLSDSGHSDAEVDLEGSGCSDPGPPCQTTTGGGHPRAAGRGAVAQCMAIGTGFRRKRPCRLLWGMHDDSRVLLGSTPPPPCPSHGPVVLMWMPERIWRGATIADLRPSHSLVLGCSGRRTALIWVLIEFSANFAATTSDKGLGLKCHVCGLRDI